MTSGYPWMSLASSQPVAQEEGSRFPHWQEFPSCALNLKKSKSLPCIELTEKNFWHGRGSGNSQCRTGHSRDRIETRSRGGLQVQIGGTAAGRAGSAQNCFGQGHPTFRVHARKCS